MQLLYTNSSTNYCQWMTPIQAALANWHARVQGTEEQWEEFQIKKEIEA